LRETNPDSTNPDGFDYGARIIAERTFMGFACPVVELRFTTGLRPRTS